MRASFWLLLLLGLRYADAVAWTDTADLFTTVFKPPECESEGVRLLQHKERVALEYYAYIDESSEVG